MAKKQQTIDDFSSLNSIPFDHLIGESLTACIDAQTEASRASLRYLAKVMTDEDPMVTFLYQMALPNGQKELRRLVIPLLTVVPFPYMKIESVDIDFRAEIENLSSNHLDVVIGNDNDNSHAGSASTESVQGSIGVRIKASASDTPAGIIKLLQLIGNEGMLVRDLPDGEVPQSRFYVPDFVVAEPDDEPEIPSMNPGGGNEESEPMDSSESKLQVPRPEDDDSSDSESDIPEEDLSMVDVVINNIQHNLKRVLNLSKLDTATPIPQEIVGSDSSRPSSSGSYRPSSSAVYRAKGVVTSRPTSSGTYRPSSSSSYRPTSSSYRPTSSGSYRPVSSSSYRSASSGSYHSVSSGSARSIGSGVIRTTSSSGKPSSGR